MTTPGSSIELAMEREVESTYSIDGDTQLIKLEPMAVTTSEEVAIQLMFPDVELSQLYTGAETCKNAKHTTLHMLRNSIAWGSKTYQIKYFV